MDHNHLFPAPYHSTQGTHWGYINVYGQYVIMPRFTDAYAFQKNGLARVQVNDRYGVINAKGQFVVKPIYGSITEFSEGRASAVKVNDGFVVINETGKVLTSKTYSYVGQYQCGRALASISKDDQTLYGYLDQQGNEVISLLYKNGYDFQDGKTVVQVKDNEFALINTSGELLQKYSYPNVGIPSEQLLSFKKSEDGKYGYINEQGEVVIRPNYTTALPFDGGVAVVNTSDDFKNKYGLINRNGDYLIQPTYNDLIILGQERVAVGKAANPDMPYIVSIYAVAKTTGQFLTDFLYKSVLQYERGVASANTTQFTFFINKNGELATGLPIVQGEGTLSFIGPVIQAHVDQRLSYYYPNGVMFWRQNTVIPLRPGYYLLEKKYKPHPNYLVYYPQLKGMENLQAQKRVNHQLKELSEVRRVTEKELEEESYTGDFDVEFFKKDLLVLKLEGYSFPFGAAHGMPSRAYPHITIKSGQFYQLEDLFKRDSHYVEVLSEIIGKQIEQKMEDGFNYFFPDAYKGIKPDQPFYVSANALNIYFEPYEIAAYVAGFPTFTIPFDHIMEMIDVEGAFWRAFHF